MPDNATDSPAHTPELSLPWRVVRPWAACASIHDASKKCIMFGSLQDEPIYQEICRRVNSAPALFDALQNLLVAQAEYDEASDFEDDDVHEPDYMDRCEAQARAFTKLTNAREASRAALAAATGSTPRSEA